MVLEDPKLSFTVDILTIILWEGDSESFQRFLDGLNQNEYGISFTGKSDYDSIEYLDLQIFSQDGGLSTKTFFKSTDRNGHIPITLTGKRTSLRDSS